MTNKKLVRDKFEFDIDFQWAILGFILTDKVGYKALLLCDYNYFDLIDQQIICKTLKRFYKNHTRIPSDIILVHELKTTFKSRDYAINLTHADRRRISIKTKTLYRKAIKDGDMILQNCINFAAYVKLKRVIEAADITDFHKYPILARNVQNAINVGIETKEDKGIFIVRGARNRQLERSMEDDIFPTPWWQVNKWTSAGGYVRHSVLCVIDKPKRGKTVFLVNTAKEYLKMRKKVIYIDLENGQKSIGNRIDQSMVKAAYPDIKSGKNNERLSKIFRKYKRIGAEMVIKRFPAYTTTTNDVQNLLDYYYTEFGIKFEVMMVDYGGLMGATTGAKDDMPRISDAFVDLKNLAEKNDFETIWTAHHVKRDAYNRRYTKFKADDTAKSIDINRHVDGMFGLQQSPEEENNKVVRLEVIEQRQGLPDATAFFWMDIRYQRVDEFTKLQVKGYETQKDTQKQESLKGGDL